MLSPLKGLEWCGVFVDNLYDIICSVYSEFFFLLFYFYFFCVENDYMGKSMVNKQEAA